MFRYNLGAFLLGGLNKITEFIFCILKLPMVFNNDDIQSFYYYHNKLDCIDNSEHEL
jgi:hypothetical protein